MNGPENTLVAVVEVEETAFAVVVACNCPITLMIPAVVELIPADADAATIPVIFTVPIEEF
jgi:hypothetical protein